MNSWMTAFLPVAGIIIGAALQSWLGRAAERCKHIDVLRAEAYADYLRAVASSAHLTSDEDLTTERVMMVSGRSPMPASAVAQYTEKFCTSCFGPTHRGIVAPRLYPEFNSARRSSFASSLPRRVKMVSHSSTKSVIGPFASVRKIAAGEADRQNMLFDTSRSRTSRTRVLPLPGSGEINARRGVVWKCRAMCAWAAQSVTAVNACSSGKEQKRLIKPRTCVNTAGPPRGSSMWTSRTLTGSTFVLIAYPVWQTRARRARVERPRQIARSLRRSFDRSRRPLPFDG